MPAITSITVEWSPASDPLDTAPTWVDITSSVKAVTISRGRGGVFELYSAGTCSIVLKNPTGTFDPTLWYRWRQVRVTCTATGPTSNVLFRGFVQNIFHDQSTVAKDAKAVIQAADLMSIMARYTFVSDQAANVVPAERSGLRVGRLVSAFLPGAWYSLATGYVDIAVPDDGNHNSLQHIQDVAESEAGALYVTRAGVLTFADRYELLTNLAGSAVTVFSNTPSGSDVPYLYGDMTLSPPGRDYRNQIIITGDSGVAQTAQNVPSNYPPDTLSRTLPIATDGPALMVAKFLLEIYRQSTVWPDGLSVSVHTQNAIDEISALDLRQLATVKVTPAGKTQQTYKVFVEQITHTIVPGHWTTSLGFSSADRLESAWGTLHDYLVIGDATYGKIGTGKIGPH